MDAGNAEIWHHNYKPLKALTGKNRLQHSSLPNFCHYVLEHKKWHSFETIFIFQIFH